MSFIARSFVKRGDTRKMYSIRTQWHDRERSEFGSGQISKDLSIGKCEAKKIIFKLECSQIYYLCVECQKEERKKKVIALCRPARKNKQLFTVFIQINCSLRSLAGSQQQQWNDWKTKFLACDSDARGHSNSMRRESDN